MTPAAFTFPCQTIFLTPSKGFKCENPKIWKGSPHQHTVSNYGAKQQFVEKKSNDLVVGKESKTYIQQVLRTFLYYACAINPPMLVVLSAIASEQASPTGATIKEVDQFLDYTASQEQAVLIYKAFDMVLAVHNDNYDITEDWEGKRYLGLTFDWNYDTRSVHLSMPNYIPDALKRFKREKPKIWQGSTHQHTVPNYGAKQQFAETESNEPVLGKEAKNIYPTSPQDFPLLCA